MNSSIAARAWRNRAQGLNGPRLRRRKGKAITALTRRLNSSISLPKRSRRSSSWTPKTARMITARVIRWVWGRSAKVSPTGQLSISRRVTSRISSP